MQVIYHRNGKQVMSTISNHDFNNLKPTLQIIRAIKLPTNQKRETTTGKKRLKGHGLGHTQCTRLHMYYVSAQGVDERMINVHSSFSSPLTEIKGVSSCGCHLLKKYIKKNIYIKKYKKYPNKLTTKSFPAFCCQCLCFSLCVCCLIMLLF